MELKSLLEKIDNSSKRRLYRVGYDDEINKLYDTIDEVTSKLKDRVRSIDTIMYHLKNNNYNITYTTSWFDEKYLHILHDNSLYTESAVGIYKMIHDPYIEDISGFGVAITMSYLDVAEHLLNENDCSYILILTKEGKLIFGNGDSIEDRLDDIFCRVGSKDKIIESVCTYIDSCDKFHVNLHNVINYVIEKLNTFEEAIDVIEKHLSECINNGCHYTIKDYNKKYPLVVSNGNLLQIYAVNNEVG